MNYYLDASYFLDRFLANPRPAFEASSDRLLSSAILEVEISRTLHRFLIERQFSERRHGTLLADAQMILAAIRVMDIDQPVLKLASLATPGVVRTLDAVHLASAFLWQDLLGEPIVLATLDRQLSKAATTLGLAVIP